MHPAASCEEPDTAPLSDDAADLATRLQAAFAAHQQGDLITAEHGYYDVLRRVPNHPDALHLLGLISKARGDLKTAHLLVSRAIAVRPTMPAQFYNFGNICDALGDRVGAQSAYQSAVALQPHYPEAWYALGNQCREQDDIKGAIQAFNQALQHQPSYREARHNLANVLRESGDALGAVRELEAVLRDAPDLAEAHYNLAFALFSLGRYQEGGAHYEWRWKSKGFSSPPRGFTQPVWDGQRMPHGTLLVYAEQGLGDTLQFIRYLRLVRPKVGQLVVEVPPALLRILKPFHDVACFIPQGRKLLPPFDKHAALLSLPYLTGEVLTRTPYLAPEPALVEKWRERLKPDGRKIIGLNWQGNPKAKVDKGRSLPLAAFAPLFDVPNVRFVSLQKNAGVEQLPAFPQVETLGDDYGEGADAFIDSAAVMEHLDLFVSSDTALAHLAGAVHCPTAVILKYVPDWRWGMTGAQSLWYPSQTLFRQDKAGDWSRPIEDIKEMIRTLSCKKPS